VTAREIAGALVPVIDALRSGASHAGMEIELRTGQLRVLSLGASCCVRRKRPARRRHRIPRHHGQRELERLREDILDGWHDMKTPITVIRGHAELLLRRLACGERDPKSSSRMPR